MAKAPGKLPSDYRQAHLLRLQVNEENAANSNKLSAQVPGWAKAQGANVVIVAATSETKLAGLEEAGRCWGLFSLPEQTHY